MLKEILIYSSIYVGLFAVTYFIMSYMSYKEPKKKFSDLKEIPKVSIIIPAYNEEESIEKTARSALDLDYPKDKIEIIIVDDGSKDNTYKIAKKIKDDNLKVFTKKNGGKYTALNYGIRKATGEYIITMDADTTAERDVLKKIVPYFEDEDVMCVTPSMVVHNPKNAIERIQQIEYFLGVYLRKAFSSMDAVHVTPGAFSTYKKEFFDKYGGFRRAHNTEDLEMSLRIQANNFRIECADDAVVYTKVPRKLKDLMKQRNRWNYGLLKNLVDYKRLISRKYGELGTIVLPIAIASILIPIFLTLYIAGKAIKEIKQDLLILQSVNFNFTNIIQINWFMVERFLLKMFSDPIFILTIVTMAALVGYMIFAKRRIKKYTRMKVSFVLFIIFYTVILTVWWLIVFGTVLFRKETKW